MLLSTSVTQNQIDLYDALAGIHSPVMKPNELIGVRVVESEGPLKGQLELKFEHDLPNGTCTFTHTCKEHTQTPPQARGLVWTSTTRTHTIQSYTNTHSHDTVIHEHALMRTHTIRSYMHTLAHRNDDTVSGRAGIHY